MASRMRYPVGGDHAVAHEIGVVRRVAEIAAVGEVLAAVGGFDPEAVVEPLPDEAALDARAGLEEMEVVRERTIRVAHRVRVFAEDDRAGQRVERRGQRIKPGAVGVGGLETGGEEGVEGGAIIGGRGRAMPVGEIEPVGEVLELGIHRADQVARGRAVDEGRLRLPAGDRALVVDDPRRVEVPDPAGGGVVGRAVAGLVAQGPCDDGGVVDVAHDHALGAVEPGGGVAMVLAEGVVEVVRLGVGLVDHVEPQLVAEVEETRVVRVVRAADGVEVEPLHQHQVLAHGLDRERLGDVGVVVVAVDALNQHAAAVYQEVAVLDLDAAQTGADRGVGGVGAGGLGRGERDEHGVERGGLVRPQPEARGGHGDAETRGAPVEHQGAARVRHLERGGFLQHRAAAGIEELHGHARPGQREILRKADRDQHLELRRPGGGRGRIEVRGDLDVRQVDAGGGVEVNGAVQTAEAPHVLVLEKGGVGILHHDGDQLVVHAGADQRGEVELGRQASVLGQAHGHAVDVDRKHAVRPAEV